MFFLNFHSVHVCIGEILIWQTFGCFVAIMCDFVADLLMWQVCHIRTRVFLGVLTVVEYFYEMYVSDVAECSLVNAQKSKNHTHTHIVSLLGGRGH